MFTLRTQKYTNKKETTGWPMAQLARARAMNNRVAGSISAWDGELHPSQLD